MLILKKVVVFRRNVQDIKKHIPVECPGATRVRQNVRKKNLKIEFFL